MAPQLVLVVKALGVYKCVYICMHSPHLQTHAHIHTHTHTHTYHHMCTHTHTDTCTHQHMHAYTHTTNACNATQIICFHVQVVVVTNGESNIMTWQWDTITMVVSTFFSSTRKTGRTACVAHSKGKRYGLKGEA